MDRRDFLKAAAAAAAVPLIPFQFFAPSRRPDTHFRPPHRDPYLSLQGGPFRKSCDGLSSYDHVPVPTMWDDIVHYRLPPPWRERVFLGLNIKTAGA